MCLEGISWPEVDIQVDTFTSISSLSYEFLHLRKPFYLLGNIKLRGYEWSELQSSNGRELLRLGYSSHT